MKSPDVVIAGGGIVGLACARELALAGTVVQVLDRGPAAATASEAAAGLLSPLFDPPYSGPLFEAGRASRDLWIGWARELREESGLPVEHDASGALILAFDPTEDAELETLRTAALALGEGAEDVTVKEARRSVPDVDPNLSHALLLPGEHRVDNVQACAALRAAVLRLGVSIRTECELAGVERSSTGVRLAVRQRGAMISQEAPLLVVATGAWSGSIPGLPALPIRPVRGQLLRLEKVSWPWRGSVRRAGRYVVRRGEGGLLVGATLEEQGFDLWPTLDGASTLGEFVRGTFPGLSDRPLSGVWAGLRPCAPDCLPVIGPLPSCPVLLATGHYRSGILLAPWTARVIASSMQQGASTPATGSAEHAFLPARFCG